MSKRKLTSIRNCEIVSYLEKDGEPLFDLDTLDSFLESKDCIKYHAYIIHNKDRYTAGDQKKNPEHKAGTLKPAHIHLLLKFEENQPQKLECVAN